MNIPIDIPESNAQKAKEYFLAVFPNNIMIDDPDYEGDGVPPKVNKFTDIEHFVLCIQDWIDNICEKGKKKLAAGEYKSIFE